MTQNLKIEVLTGDISIDGMVVTNLVTKEELSTAIVKKADLGTDGKIPTSQLPAEIVNTAGIVDEVKLQLETSIKDAVDESNAYAESYTDNALTSKADLTSGKVPLEQLPAIDQYPQFGAALSNLSTSILTSVKQRTDQLEKSKADLGEDGKVLREQIPSYEKISGLPEQLELMTTQTAAVSGELDEYKLQTADQIDTLKENIEANVQQLTDRQSHLMRTYATKELGVDTKVGVKSGEYFYVRSANEDEMLVEYQNVGGVATPSEKSYPSSGYVHEIAVYTALPFSDSKSYKLNERVQLENGAIVKSTVPNNTNDPNIDMTGWIDTSNNISIVKTIADLIAINNPKDGDVVHVKGYYAPTNFALAQPYKGGGQRIYVDSRKNENDGFLCINGWILQIQDGVVTPEQAGAKGDLVQDDAPFIRTVIKSLSKAGGGVINLTGKYLLDSYRAEGSTDIFELWNNITFQGIGDSQFFVGNSFHNKGVIVFNNPWFLTTPLRNVLFKDVRITSDIANNHMVSDYPLRIGVHFESSVDCGYIGGSIDNFDCQNAIISGWIDSNGWSGTAGADFSRNTVIDGVRFTNLAYDSANYDHSTCYIISMNSVVKNCIFQGSLQTQKVGCATELHNSHTSFIDNFVAGYTRGVWLAANETPDIADLLVARNRFFVTNHMTIITTEAGIFRNARVLDNYCECNHPEGFETPYVGRQGLFVSSGTLDGSEATGFEFARNTVKIKRSSDPTLASAFSMQFFVTDFNIHDNNFYGAQCFYLENTSLHAWKILENKFYGVTTNTETFGSILNITNNSVSGFQFSKNTLQFSYGTAPGYTIKFDANITSIVGCDISENTYSQNNPKNAELKFPSATIDLYDGNRFSICYFKCSGTYSSASGNSWGVLSITQPQAFPFRTKAEVVYSPPTERMLSGVAHYHGASSIKIPFYVESAVSTLNVTDIGVRFIVG